MNDLLLLRGAFENKRANPPGRIKFPSDADIVRSSDLLNLADNIKKLIEFWENDPLDLDIDPLVSVYYKRIVPKSCRVKRLLDPCHGNSVNTMVGARFENNQEGIRRHVITHQVKLGTLVEAKKLLLKCASTLEECFNGVLNQKTLFTINNGMLKKNGIGIKKTAFSQLMRDVCSVERIDLIKDAPERNDLVLVTFFSTGKSSDALLECVGARALRTFKPIEDSVLMKKDQYEILREKAPFLVAMATEDINELTFDSFDFNDVTNQKISSLPFPANEPVVGVIDTPFNDNAYFSDWVDSETMIDSEIMIEAEDKHHGTAVTSIIVDGPSLNPELDDHCGRFRVKHFGVALKQSGTYSIMEEINNIVAANPEIKVWNLSLGSPHEINENSISYEGALLDEIQSKNDVIFIVAGTNKNDKYNQKRIGSPADSLNALVVNAVDENGARAAYSRQGPVLSFFQKPDISYYGGSESKRINVGAPYGIAEKAGTSFAAAWITRKIAYLIHVVGMTREAAKALLIESAIGWDNKIPDVSIGYGTVPIDIRDILRTKPDEIRFVINGIASEYETYNYKLPVPLKEDKCPYIARATLCYFPNCRRSQGVDYPVTELDLHFGQMKESGIKPLNGNRQGIEGAYINEGEARNLFRKWDNVKHISDECKQKMRSRKTYGNNFWGIRINKTTREDRAENSSVAFGLVVTLKDITGTNRYAEFIQQCMMRGWFVNRVNLEAQMNLYETAEAQLNLEN